MSYPKRLAAIASMAAFFLSLVTFQSTEARQAETLFDGSITHGGFGGPVVKIGEVNGAAAAWVGGRGGWIINLNREHALSLGGGGYFLATEHLAPAPGLVNSDEDYFALTGYGGFELEYTNRSYRLIHLTATTLIGGGTLMLRERNFDEVSDDIETYFVVEPGLHAELNVTSFFRIGAGATYRITSGINRFGFSDSDFSGLNGVITLKFGGF
ncbi:MAG: hypothetical protein JJU46_09885 [Balneolaceae bacterium]|nr:hypothetical protein [Balneolaceae bacterium]MCH8547770.1 hypothetical protein [Balneolaceae bacterium]